VLASGKLFAERGYYNTSMDDIAAEVGILKGSLYHHVGSKEAILDRILVNTGAGLLARTQEIDGSRLPAEDRFDLMVKAMVRNTTEVAHDGTIIYATEHHRLPSIPRDKCRSLLKQQRQLFEDTVRQLVSERKASLDGDDIEFAVTTIIGFTAMMSLWYRPTGRLTLVQIEDQFVRHARRMIGLRPFDVLS
jgi:TetR/AcrR family transcriptional regulator, cholesterol catabolism regulator